VSGLELRALRPAAPSLFTTGRRPPGGQKPREPRLTYPGGPPPGYAICGKAAARPPTAGGPSGLSEQGERGCSTSSRCGPSIRAPGPRPPAATRGKEPERPERRHLYPAGVPPAEWEDEWVDLGARGEPSGRPPASRRKPELEIEAQAPLPAKSCRCGLPRQGHLRGSPASPAVSSLRSCKGVAGAAGEPHRSHPFALSLTDAEALGPGCRPHASKGPEPSAAAPPLRPQLLGRHRPRRPDAVRLCAGRALLQVGRPSRRAPLLGALRSWGTNRNVSLLLLLLSRHQGGHHPPQNALGVGGRVGAGGPRWTCAPVRFTNLKCLPGKKLMAPWWTWWTSRAWLRLHRGDWGWSSQPHAGVAGADVIWVDEVHQVH
jgi:hypothetical protein